MLAAKDTQICDYKQKEGHSSGAETLHETSDVDNSAVRTIINYSVTDYAAAGCDENDYGDPYSYRVDSANDAGTNREEYEECRQLIQTACDVLDGFETALALYSS